jgi:hypothetical protein
LLLCHPYVLEILRLETLTFSDVTFSHSTVNTNNNNNNNNNNK